MLTLQLTLAARYLWGRKLRTFLTTLAIVFGAWLIFAMNILMPTMLKAFQVNMLAASGQVDVTITLSLIIACLVKTRERFMCSSSLEAQSAACHFTFYATPHGSARRSTRSQLPPRMASTSASA